MPLKKNWSCCSRNILQTKHKYWSYLTSVGVTVAILVNTIFVQQTLAQSLLMNTKEQITEMVYRQAKAWEEQNAQAIANDFAENAIFIAAGSMFEGKQHIRKAAQDYFNQFANTQVEIKRIIVDGEQGAVEWYWRDQERKTGQSGYAEDAIIFQLRDGKIVYWREYIEQKKKQV